MKVKLLGLWRVYYAIKSLMTDVNRVSKSNRGNKVDLLVAFACESITFAPQCAIAQI